MTGRPPRIRDDDILDAARDVFREQGFATTTAEIARRAGIAEGSVFYRFHTKEALIAALIDRETRPPEVLREVVPGRGTVVENLERIVSAVLASVERGHPFFELLDASPLSCEVRALLRRHSSPPPREVVAGIAAYLGAEAALGRIRPVAFVTVGRAVFGACVDRARSRRFTADEGDDDAFVRGLVDVLVAGVEARSPSPLPESP